MLLRTYTKYAESIRLRRTQLWPDRKDSDIAYSRLSQLPGSYARRIPFLHDRSRKKKATDRAVESQGVIDPLAEFDIDIQSFDIERTVSVYPDKDGIVWWTKAWFNGKAKGERAIEITRELAIKFIQDNIKKDEWLEEYYPQQMQILHAALAQTREQVIQQLKQTYT